MKKGIIFLLILTLIVVFAASYGNHESIVVCYSMEQFRGEEMQKQLQEQFPDKNIIVTYMPTGKAAAKIYAEGPQTEIDILVGLETGYLNKIRGSLADISGCSRIPYFSQFQLEKNDNLWVTWEKQAGAIAVNRDVMDKYDLPMPRTFEDLLNPVYKDLIAMPVPLDLGSGKIGRAHV